MSDFVNNGWAWFVAGMTVLSLVWCFILLLIASKRKVMAGDNTTGHVWDEDLRELNNPLPRWWMYLFVLTVVFSAVYLAFYPGLGTFAGTLKWSSVGQYEAEQEKARQAMVPVYAKYATMTAEQLGADAQAMGIGQNLSFILVFATAAFFAVLGVITVIASLLDYNIDPPHNFEGVSISGVVMLVILAIFNAFDYLTKIGDKVALISWSVVCLLIGFLTMAVCVYVWMGLGGAA